VAKSSGIPQPFEMWWCKILSGSSGDQTLRWL